MERVKHIIVDKPLIFILLTMVYIELVAFIKWKLTLNVDVAWFTLGGIFGIYFLDFGDWIFNVKPSPFRSMIFVALFAIVLVFIITSSGNPFASGLVLSIFLQMLFWQLGQFRMIHNLDSWYRMFATPVSQKTEQWMLVGMGLFQIVMSIVYCRM